jgi:maltose-binding protein MalE
LIFSFVSIITAEELVLWHTSFVNEWGGREKLVNYFEENTNLNVSNDYGPALYRDVAQKLIIQGKTGKPDVIEGTLEQLITYAKADLIMPLNNFWENYEDKQEYASNVMDAVTIDGQIYGIPFNTNVRLLLYRK